jgi:hypothetical protein
VCEGGLADMNLVLSMLEHETSAQLLVIKSRWSIFVYMCVCICVCVCVCVYGLGVLWVGRFNMCCWTKGVHVQYVCMMAWLILIVNV